MIEPTPGPNLLVSSSWRAPGRSRREIAARLRALGDPAPLVTPTDRNGVVAARTTLEPREVIRGLRALHQASPAVFRYTYKWVPVDLWSKPDLESLRGAVEHLRNRIAPGERWRISVERRTAGRPALPEIIDALAALIDAPVDLSHPDKTLLVELFDDRAALAVVAPEDTLTVVGAPAPSAERKTP
jgi:tRNA(Ser,Leu) C12 N-acetylase TAN1